MRKLLIDMIIDNGIILYKENDVLKIQKDKDVVMLYYFDQDLKQSYNFDLSDIKGIKQKNVYQLDRFAINFISKSNDIGYVVKFTSHVSCCYIFNQLADSYGIRDLDYLERINNNDDFYDL